tara:strand:- start:146 stop:1087 length:942 start_codon:yes stop_codon:yes gene_type:complete
MIITLHRVSESLPKTFKANISLYTKTKTLRRFILNMQEKKKQFVSLDKYLNSNNKKNYISITFDDGYLDNLNIAYPILKKLNIPFTIYVTTNFINNQNLPWWFLLEDYLVKNYLKRNNICDNYESYQNKIFNDPKENAEFLKVRNKILDNVFDLKKLDKFNKFTHKRLGERLFMNWHELKKISSDKLVTIGSHTISHKRLSNCSNEERNIEIIDSKNILEKNLEYKVNHFAYPFGGLKDFTKKDMSILKKNNYFSAVSTISRNSLINNDKFMFPRFSLSEEYKNPLHIYEKVSHTNLRNISKDLLIYTYRKII